jgi:hypothetical protein
VDLDRFERAAEAAFAFLEHEFGMRLERDSRRREHWWARNLGYRGDRAYVRVELDDRDRAFNVLVGPSSGEDEAQRERFPLWAIVRSRGAREPSFSFAEDERLDRELAAWRRR